MLGYVQPFLIQRHSDAMPLWPWIWMAFCLMLVAVVSVGLLAAMLETRSARKKLKNRFNWRSSDRWTPVQKELVERLYAAMPPQFQFVASGALAEKAAVIMNYNDAYGQCEAVDWYERALVGVRTKQD